MKTAVAVYPSAACYDPNVPRDRKGGAEPTDGIQAAFRSRMRELALKGGAATKKRHGADPRYYHSIGRLGGKASVAARKARIAAELGAPKPGAAPIVEPCAASDEATAPLAREVTTLRDVLADIEREEPRVSDPSNRRQPLADLQAQRDFTAWVARIRETGADDVEPWDPWSKRSSSRTSR